MFAGGLVLVVLCGIALCDTMGAGPRAACGRWGRCTYYLVGHPVVSAGCDICLSYATVLYIATMVYVCM